MQKQLNIPHVSGMVFNTPLFATRQLVDSVKSVLLPRMGRELTVNNLISASEYTNPDLKVETQIHEPTSNIRLTVSNSIAIIKVHGVLTTRRGHITESCEELLSYEYLRNQVQAALELDEIQYIALDFHSGGGMATGCKEFADFIFEAQKIKPIYAIVNYYAYSAAYFIAAACTEIFISQTGGLGSIGVIYEHMEFSDMVAEMGIKVTPFFRGNHKNDLTEYEPVSEAAALEVNKKMDSAYKLFTDSVAAYRNINVDEVIATQAKTFEGKEAVGIGLADHLMTPEEAINHIFQKVVHPSTKQPKHSIALQAKAMEMQVSTSA